MVMMVMMVMVMIVLVLVLVLVMVMVMVMVPKTLSQVGWLRQCQSQSITDLEPISQSFHKLRVFHRLKAYRGNSTPPKGGSLKCSSQAQLFQAGSQAGFKVGSQAGSQVPAGSPAA
jgi:predicted PurR-regulated permease PerM